ncbi:hypothetical protein BUALT_Bualt11G0132700 [Buddleja alternifolia]|uniref:non-specific serine/threonine protein kinase n=1 Tax=Buddleja alternifolia TaxID=168488 RepID=A0AAV6X1Y8_9LAMI|nr:hypothetical protein BUALT_Bualt11G0132700 [Buddleja alternifolia]
MAQPNFFIKLLIFCTLFISSTSFDFHYNGFNESNLDLIGSTIIQPSGALKLTNRSHNVIGHAFYPTPISMFNNSPNASSFSTYFIFQIVPSSSNDGGYGLAFTLSPSPGFPNAADGHYLGIVNQSNNNLTSNHIFLVEFDTVDGHNEESDTDGNHIGININGVDSLSSTPASYHINDTLRTEEVRLGGGLPVQAWIDYDGLNKVVNVTVSPLSVPKPIRRLLFAPIDLSQILVENMYVGFSAATGIDKSSSHYILGWSFRLNGIANPLDLSQLPTVPDENLSSSNDKLKKALISTFSVLLFILLVALLCIIYYRRVVMRFEVLEEWEMDYPHRFRYKDLYKATKGFKESEKIGAGGFGAVYKGVLPANGVEVAVKKIISKQGMREFAAEIESLGRLRHKHLVNLQGWCKYKNDLLLVYDYVSNGSLDSLLYKCKNGNIFLHWEQRFNIIKGIASGLLYLHEEWEKVVIHRDVKSSNILIDRDMNAKLGDFGLARLCDHGNIAHTTNVVGTIGYIAPELVRTGKASTGTDVFAYGILLLEVACGRGPVVYEKDRNVILVDWVVECLKMGNILDAVDEKLNSSYVVEEMELVLGLGLICSHPKAEARPSMKQVMKYLNGDELLPVFDELSLAGSRRVDELTARFLALGLEDSFVTTTSYKSVSVGAISSSSFDSGR